MAHGHRWRLCQLGCAGCVFLSQSGSAHTICIDLVHITPSQYNSHLIFAPGFCSPTWWWGTKAGVARKGLWISSGGSLLELDATTDQVAGAVIIDQANMSTIHSVMTMILCGHNYLICASILVKPTLKLFEIHNFTIIDTCDLNLFRFSPQ